VIWLAVTGVAFATIVALIVALVWGLGQVLNVFAPVIWPLAVAAVLACLLDPVVEFLVRKRVPRMRAIVIVTVTMITCITIIPISRRRTLTRTTLMTPSIHMRPIRGCCHSH